MIPDVEVPFALFEKYGFPGLAFGALLWLMTRQSKTHDQQKELQAQQHREERKEWMDQQTRLHGEWMAAYQQGTAAVHELAVAVQLMNSRYRRFDDSLFPASQPPAGADALKPQ
jgi:hypothetical protein